MALRQSDLATLFGRSQSWVSKHQARATDPMPKDRTEAISWGHRNGLLPDELQSSAKQSANPAPLESAEIRLKGLRATRIETEIGLLQGTLLRRDEVEQREVRIAAEFRRAACAYPLKARAILERHLADAGQVDRIVKDLDGIAVELLNCADPRGLLKELSPDQLRMILLAHVEELCACIHP